MCNNLYFLSVFECWNFRSTMTANVLGIAEGGKFMAESLNSALRRAKTNFYELNLKIKNE